VKKSLRYIVETRLTGSFQSLKDAKVWAAEQRENDMQVSDPQKLGDGWLCIATETATIESYKI
jgi:hypothetical protein